MPSRRDGLQCEALARKSQSILTFAEFLRREPVAVRGECAVDVGRREPGGAEEAGFHFGELDVDVLWEAALGDVSYSE